MRFNKVLTILVALAVLTGGSIAFAQGIPTATLTGKALNEGQGLPGVTVTAKSPALQGTRTAVTSTNGDFVFPNLPPGDYTISFTMSGFQTVTRTVKANASQQAAVNAPMSLAAVAAEAVVVGTPETISQTTQNATTYSVGPHRRSSRSPGRSSRRSSSPRASTTTARTGNTDLRRQSFDNLFMVNGVVVNENLRGTPNNLFIEDAIQETTTSTSGISAEYGRFTGGVVTAITKSGGNNFSGSFRAASTNDNWNDKHRPVPYGVNPQGPTRPSRPTRRRSAGPSGWTGSGSSAPAALRESDARRPRPRTRPHLPLRNNEPRIEGKLTISPFQNHSLVGSYLDVEPTKVNNSFTASRSPTRRARHPPAPAARSWRSTTTAS